MTVNLDNDEELLDFLANKIYPTGIPEVFVNGALKDTKFIFDEQNDISVALSWIWLKKYVPIYLKSYQKAPFLMVVDDKESRKEEWFLRVLAKGDKVYHFDGESVPAELVSKIKTVSNYLEFIADRYLTVLLSENKRKAVYPNLLEQIIGKGYNERLAKDYGTLFEYVLPRADEWREVYGELYHTKIATTAKMTAGTSDILSLSSGFKVVQLLTPDALDMEAKSMGHCLGKGGYDCFLNDKKAQIYSLRDADDRPHATVLVRGGKVLECKGKADKPVVMRYVPYLKDMFNKLDIVLEQDLANMGLCRDVNGVLHSIFDIPEGTVFDILNLRNTNISCLPHKLVVNNSIDLSGTNISALPNDLVVNGNMYLRNVCISYLPDNFCVGRALFCGFSEIKEFPKGLKVGTDFDLSYAKIKSLPDDLQVGRSLFLNNSNISELPENLCVKGTLDLSESKITELPDKLSAEAIIVRRCNDLAYISPQIPSDKIIGLDEMLIDRMKSDYEQLHSYNKNFSLNMPTLVSYYKDNQR